MCPDTITCTLYRPMASFANLFMFLHYSCTCIVHSIQPVFFFHKLLQLTPDLPEVHRFIMLGTDNIILTIRGKGSGLGVGVGPHSRKCSIMIKSKIINEVK